MRFSVWRYIEHNRFAQFIILGLTTLICYFGLWDAYFAFGDDFVITGRILHMDSIAEALQGYGRAMRSLNYASIWIKTRFFGMEAAPYFWASMIQHVIVTFLVYWLAELLTKQRLIAFAAALIFAVRFSYWEVVTSVSASDYAFWGIFYLLTITLFIAYFQSRKRVFFAASIMTYLLLALAHDFTLHLPLILLAYHLIVGRGSQPIRSLYWADLRIHLLYWVIWGVHVSLQIYFVLTGTGEAVASAQPYGPGLHMLENLTNLAYLIIPNIPVYPSLARTFGSSIYDFIQLLTVLTAVVMAFLAIRAFWKGPALIRLTVMMTVIPYLQYTLWHGGFAGVSRYFYTPSIGFSILLALLAFRLGDYLRQREVAAGGTIVSGLVGLWLLANVIVIQAWVQRHISNSEFRRHVVSQMPEALEDVEPGSWVYFEVPEAKYEDLQHACRLIFEEDRLPFCRSYTLGESSLGDLGSTVERPVYVFQATAEGLRRIYP